MNGIKGLFLLLFLAVPFVHPSAQDTLSLDEALVTALENNFSISLARNEQKISSINNTPGNAGMLPEGFPNR